MGDSTTATLRSLLTRLAAGEDVRDSLLEHSQSRLHHLARSRLNFHEYRRVREKEMTDDVFQAAAMRLFSALQNHKPTTIRDYLGLAAELIRRELVSLCRHHFCKRRRHGTARPGDNQSSDSGGRGGHEPADPMPSPADAVAYAELLEAVRECLPEKEREVFDLVYFLEQTQEEIAELLGVSVQIVGRLWRKARLRLKEGGLLDG
jgi:RNA polymerase sigma factor (sigma-70 family)